MAISRKLAEQLFDETLKMITADARSWIDFLDFAAHFYKYTFKDQVMIYGQKPTATACASYSFWENTMHRSVQKGTKGIALFDEDTTRLRYIFDIGDTVGTSELYKWQYDETKKEIVKNTIEGVFAMESISEDVPIEKILADLAEQQIKDETSELDDDSKQFYLKSLLYIMLTRCGLQVDKEYKALTDELLQKVNTNISVLGNVISSDAKNILKQIGNVIKEYDFQKEGIENDIETDLHGEGRDPLSEPDEQSAGRDNRKIWPNAQGAYENKLDEKSANDSGTGREPSSESVPDGRGSESTGKVRTDRDFSDEEPAAKGKPKADKSKGMDVPQESDKRDGREIDAGRGDIHLERISEDARPKSTLYLDTFDKNKEPYVYIGKSEHHILREGIVLSLSDANALFQKYDKEAIDNQSSDTVSYYKVNGVVFFYIDGKMQTYDFRQDLGDGHGSLLDYLGKTINSDGKDLSKSMEVLLRHQELSELESMALDSPDGKKQTDILEYVYLCRSLLNNASNVVFPERPAALQSQDREQIAFTMPEVIPVNSLGITEDDAQISLFDADSDVSEEIVDKIIAAGGNDADSVKEIFFLYQTEADAEYRISNLKNIYGIRYGRQYGRGFIINNKRYSVWIDKEGIRIANGNSCRYDAKSKLLTWEECDGRISALISKGKYITNEEKSNSKEVVAKKLATSFEFMARELSDEAREKGYLQNLRAPLKSLHFDELINKYIDIFVDPDDSTKAIEELRSFVAAYEQDNSLLRFKHYLPAPILRSLELLNKEQSAYEAKEEYAKLLPSFITQDEFDFEFTRGGVYSGSSYNTFVYFKMQDSFKDRVTFLKEQFGNGGHYSGEYGLDYSSKGFSFERRYGGEEYEKTVLKWDHVAKRIEKLINENRYFDKEQIEKFYQYGMNRIAGRVDTFFSYVKCADIPYDRKNIFLHADQNRKTITEKIRRKSEAEMFYTIMKETFDSMDSEDRGYNSCQEILDEFEQYISGKYLCFDGMPQIIPFDIPDYDKESDIKKGSSKDNNEAIRNIIKQPAFIHRSVADDNVEQNTREIGREI